MQKKILSTATDHSISLDNTNEIKVGVAGATKPETISEAECTQQPSIGSSRLTRHKQVYSQGLIHSHIPDFRSLAYQLYLYPIQKERKECTILYRIYTPRKHLRHRQHSAVQILFLGGLAATELQNNSFLL